MNPGIIQRLSNVIKTIVFPGYNLWVSNKKIESYTISIAVYFGYLIFIGYYIHLYLIYYSWMKAGSQQFAITNSISIINKNNIFSSIGLILAIFFHPLFLLLSHFWSIVLSNSQFNIPVFIIILIFINFLRYTFFILIFEKFNANNFNKIYLINTFSINNLSNIFFVPFSILFYMNSSLIYDPLIFIQLVLLSFIFSIKILLNNLHSIKDKQI